MVRLGLWRGNGCVGQGAALGLDRFGRPKRLKAVASGATVFECAYSYDRVHDLTLKDGQYCPGFTNTVAHVT